MLQESARRVDALRARTARGPAGAGASLTRFSVPLLLGPQGRVEGEGPLGDEADRLQEAVRAGAAEGVVGRSRAAGEDPERGRAVGGDPTAATRTIRDVR